jgi:hypothetical protein
MDGILCFPPFRRFSETLVLPYVLTYGGTGYGFFCQPLLLNAQILSISKIEHTDKDIIGKKGGNFMGGKCGFPPIITIRGPIIYNQGPIIFNPISDYI